MEENSKFDGIIDTDGLDALINMGIVDDTVIEDDSDLSDDVENNDEDSVDVNNTESVTKALEEEGVDINLDINFPRVIIPKTQLVQALSLASVVIKSNSSMHVPQSLTIIPKTDGVVSLFTTDEMNVFSCDVITGLSDEDLLKENVCIQATLLTKLIPVMGNYVLIYKNTDESDEENYNKLFIRLMGGDLVLGVQAAEESMLDQPMEKGELISSVVLSDLDDIVKTMLPLVNLEARPSNQKITFVDNKAYYNSPIYIIKGNMNLPNLVLTRVDCEYIKRLSSYFKGASINLYKVKDSKVNRILIECGNCVYTFISATPSVEDRFKQLIENAEAKDVVDVKYNQLLRITNLAVVLTYSVGRIGFRYTNDYLEATIPSKKGDSFFKIDYSKKDTEVTESDKFITIQADQLKKLLQSFSNVQDISICIEDNMVVIKHDKYVAIFMHSLN